MSPITRRNASVSTPSALTLRRTRSGLRTRSVGSCPALSRAATVCAPMKPVPPVIITRMGRDQTTRCLTRLMRTSVSRRPRHAVRLGVSWSGGYRSGVLARERPGVRLAGLEVKHAKVAAAALGVDVEVGPELHQLRPELCLLLGIELAGAHLRRDALEGHLGVGVGDQVGGPGRVLLAAEVAADDVPAVPVRLGRQRSGALLPALGPGGRQDQGGQQAAAGDELAA